MASQNSHQQILEYNMNQMLEESNERANTMTLRESPSLQGLITEFEVVGNVPFMAPGIIAESRAMKGSNLIYIATNRSRTTWITSMMADWMKGGTLFRQMYGLPDLFDRVVTPDEWGAVYDRHQALLLGLNLPVMSLEDSDSQKFKIFCAATNVFGPALSQKCKTFAEVTQWPRANPTPMTLKASIGMFYWFKQAWKSGLLPALFNKFVEGWPRQAWT
jgi:hypothetical protein